MDNNRDFSGAQAPNEPTLDTSKHPADARRVSHMIRLAFAAALAFFMPALAAATLAAPAPPSPEQVMAVPAELRLRFRQEVLDARGSQAQRVERLVHFLFDDSGLGMKYRHDATYTVEQAYLTRNANCLTFTLLAVALAREAGLEAYGQEIQETLTWRQEGNTIYRTNHVNAGVLVQPRRRFTVDVASDSVIARHPPRSISDHRLLAHYYNNRAAELMGDDLRAAAPYMAMSLQIDPGYAPSWSNAGVLQLREGNPDVAERHYKRALALDPVHASTLFNLVSLYRRTGDLAQAATFNRRLEKLQSKDPFHQFLQATEHEKQGNYPLALKAYQRAIKLHGDEHRFHFGLARAYLQTGDARRAGNALARAHALSDGDTRRLYHAKLDSLKLGGK